METIRGRVEEVKALRERMRARGVPVVRLAREANLYENDMFRILSGGKIGPMRRARIDAAVRRLGLSEDEGDAE